MIAPTEPASAEHAIPHLLKNLHHSVRQAVDEAFRVQGVDMSVAQFMVLVTLASEPGIAGAELARRAFVTAQTMNTIVRRLERDGDIDRRPHPDKARAHSWFVTKPGQVRLNRARVVAEAVWMRMFSVLKQAEVQQMQSMLKRCIRGLDMQLNGKRMVKLAKTSAVKKTPIRKVRRRSR